MSRRLLRVGLRVAVLLAAIGSASTGWAQEAISEEAKLYFSNGVELLQGATPNYTDAYYQFRLAYEKSGGSWKVLGNLGLCAMKLERDGEAIDYYTKYLAEGGDEIDPEERQTLQRELLLLNGNSVEVTISSPVPDLDVTDTRLGSGAPTQAYDIKGGSARLRLRAGTHVITATHEGKALRWEVVLSPGRPQSHTFDFAQPAEPPPAAPAAGTPTGAPPPGAEPKQSGGTLRTVGFVTAGVGAAALVGGVVTGLITNGKESDARDQCRDEAGGTVCPESAEADFDSAQSMATVTNVLLIGGGMLTAAGVGLIIFGGPTESPQTASLRLTPVLGPKSSGLFASGSF